jgi:hypothetical protein
MSFDFIGNGSSFTPAQWDNFSSHVHAGSSRDGVVLSSNAFSNSPLMLGVAQMAYQQMQVTTFTNQDFLAADQFTTGSGKNNTASGGTAFWAGSYYFSNADSTLITQNLLPLDGTEKSATVYAQAEYPTGTSMSVNYSDGTNNVLGAEINKVTDISSLSTGSLALTFNFTANGSLSPKLLGYGVAMTR